MQSCPNAFLTTSKLLSHLRAYRTSAKEIAQVPSARSSCNHSQFQCLPVWHMGARTMAPVCSAVPHRLYLHVGRLLHLIHLRVCTSKLYDTHTGYLGIQWKQQQAPGLSSQERAFVQCQIESSGNAQMYACRFSFRWPHMR